MILGELNYIDVGIIVTIVLLFIVINWKKMKSEICEHKYFGTNEVGIVECIHCGHTKDLKLKIKIQCKGNYPKRLRN